MGAQADTEKVLRNLHLLLSKSEKYNNEPNKVIIDKQKMLDLLTELNTCIYQIMEEYELTRQSRDEAERNFRKQGDQIIWDASRKAEDVYAASVMYMEETLNRMQDIMMDADQKVAEIYSEMKDRMKKEKQEIRTNQYELKSQLQDLVDTEKYLKLIEERNREIEKEKHEGEAEAESEKSIYAGRQTEIRVNQEYLEKLGMSIVDEGMEEDEKPEEDEELKRLEATIRVNLDADYFKWKEENQGETDNKEKKADMLKEKTVDLQKKLKNLIGGHPHDNTDM